MGKTDCLKHNRNPGQPYSGFPKKTKHEYKVNFSIAAHICRVFLQPKKDPIDVMSLLRKELIPIRNERQYKRLTTAHFRKPRYFIYQAS